MNQIDLSAMCDPTTSGAMVAKLGEVMRVLSGLSGEEARSLLRYAGNAVDCLSVVPTLDS